MNDIVLQRLTKLLWGEDNPIDRQVHWLLDGARAPDIASVVRSSGLEFECLFTGPLHPRLQAAAPYLVRLSPDSPASSELLRRGWGKSWGILSIAGAEVTLERQRLHFKKFLRVKTEQGKMLAFRYYDPRVLKVFLPTCTNEEFKTFLGPLQQLIAEGTEGPVLCGLDCVAERCYFRKSAYK